MGATSSPAVRDPLDCILAALADPHRRQVVELQRERPRRAQAGVRAEACTASTAAQRTRGLLDFVDTNQVAINTDLPDLIRKRFLSAVRGVCTCGPPRD